MNPVAWDRARGQHTVAEALRNAARSETVPHAVMLVGAPGLGQNELVAALIAAVECPDAADAQGCGTCNTCRRVVNGSWTGHQTFHRAGATHLVRQVREEWLPAATRTGVEGDRKVLRITDADRMSEVTQNAFLKVLEEPPPSVLWVLEVENPDRLLDTIESRVRRLDLTPLTADELAAWAADELDPVPDDDTLAGLVRAAAGSPLRLAQLCEPQRAKTRDLALDTLRRLTEVGPPQVDEVSRDVVSLGKRYASAVAAKQERVAESLHDDYAVDNDRDLPNGLLTGLKKQWKREQTAAKQRPVYDYLDDLGTWLRDLATVSTCPGGRDVWERRVVNRDRSDRLAVDGRRFDLHDLLEGLRAIERCRETIARNGQAEVQLSTMLLTLAGPAYLAGRR